MENFRDAARHVLSAKTILQLGRRAEDIAKQAANLPEEDQIAFFTVFRDEARRLSAIDYDIGAPGNRGWMICPKETTIPTFFTANMDPEFQGTDFVEWMQQWGRDVQRGFQAPSACLITKDDAETIMRYLDSKYQISDRLFTDQKTVLMLLPDVCPSSRSQSFLHNSGQNRKTRFHFAFYGGTSRTLYDSFLFSSLHPLFIEMAGALLIQACWPEGDGAPDHGMPSNILRLAEPILPGISNDTKWNQLLYIAGFVACAMMLDSPACGILANTQKNLNKTITSSSKKLLRCALDMVPVQKQSLLVKTTTSKQALPRRQRWSLPRGS